MELLTQFLAVFSDLPGHLTQWMQMMGPWLYVLLFVILFAETGLVVTPLLPGDSLLFAVGALTAIEGGLDFTLISVLLVIAAILGDAVNYSIGRWLAPKLFRNRESKLLNPKHLEKTQAFYERHGGKTIILARFLPILRTYAPFVAGLCNMNYSRFAAYNVVGGIVWVMLFLALGHFFGNLPQVKSNFQYVILAIIVLSLLPVVIEFLRARRTKPSAGPGGNAKQGA